MRSLDNFFSAALLVRVSAKATASIADNDIRANAFVFLPPDARDEDDCTLEIDDHAFDLVDLEVAWLLKECESESMEDNDSA